MFSPLIVFLHFLTCNISQSESKQDYNYFNDMVNYLAKSSNIACNASSCPYKQNHSQWNAVK